tara:strand:- start:39515 stop:39814 length:300 start_codon:yes stop_codon:yes gene_type:complete
VGLPKSIAIAGHRIKVEAVPFGDDDPPYGLYFHDKKLIQVNKKIKGKILLDTIRHEMMEASLLLSGVGWLESYEQESVVRCMEEIFFPAWETFLKTYKT